MSDLENNASGLSRSNYSYLNRNQHFLKKGIKMIIHNGIFEPLLNPEINEIEQVWKATNPIYVMFSWVNKRGEKYATPIEFNIPVEEFREKIVRFLAF